MPEQWTIGVVIKVLEAAHGKWLYCCIQVLDRVQGTLATQHQKEIQWEIEAQQDQGFE